MILTTLPTYTGLKLIFKCPYQMQGPVDTGGQQRGDSHTMQVLEVVELATLSRICSANPVGCLCCSCT